MPKGISIHIGMEYIDPAHYNGDDGALRTCGKDALDMQEIATSQNFESTTLLMNEDATRDAVTKAIAQTAEKLESGDMLFISYSGHGSFVPDMNGDEKDKKDETWCLYDGFLLDDELYALWTRFVEGVRIMVVSDSCHSGTVTKLSPGQDPETMIVSKYFPAEEAEKVYLEHKAFYLKIKAEAVKSKNKKLKASVKLIAGCQEDESSYVLSSDENSLLTKELNRVWDAGQFVGTTVEFFEQIKKGVEETAEENKIYQTPNLYDVGKKNEAFDTQKPFGIYEVYSKTIDVKSLDLSEDITEIVEEKVSFFKKSYLTMKAFLKKFYQK